MAAARYRIQEDIRGRPLIIEDVGPWDQHMTITNDIENVITDLIFSGKLTTGRRLFYFDSEGELTEALWSEEDGFKGYRPGVLSQ